MSTIIATILREGFRWNITQDNSKEEGDGFKYQILMKEEWYIITSNDTEERIALRIARWRKNLSSLEKNLDENFEKELNP